MTDHVETLDQVPTLARQVLEDTLSLEPGTQDALADATSRALVEEIAAIAAGCNDRAALRSATSKEALDRLGAKHGVKGRALFRPIRIAATGQEHGIELPVLLPLLGPARLASRLRLALSQTG
jgi:glutamyl/glutaminyl-tRNA synthetase